MTLTKNSKTVFFLRDILLSWRHITMKDSIKNNENTIIWNNSLIRNGEGPAFFKTWLDKGIKTLEDIFDFRNKSYYKFDNIQYLYNIPNVDFLKYGSLIKSIPGTLTSLIKSEIPEKPPTSILLEKIQNIKKHHKSCI